MSYTYPAPYQPAIASGNAGAQAGHLVSVDSRFVQAGVVPTPGGFPMPTIAVAADPNGVQQAQAIQWDPATGTAYAVQPTQMAAMQAGQAMHVQQGPIHVPSGPTYYQMPAAYNGLPTVMDANGQTYIDPHYYNIAQTSGAATFVQAAAPGAIQQGTAMPAGAVAIASAPPHVQVTSTVASTTATTAMAQGPRPVAIPTATVTPTVAVPATATVTVTPVATVGNPPSVTTSASEVHSSGLKQCDVKANEQVCGWLRCFTLTVAF
eukprot:scpid43943/ scgid5439/ 